MLSLRRSAASSGPSSEAVNLLRGRLRAENGQVVAKVGTASITLPERVVPRPALARGDVVLGLRPEHLGDAELAGADGRPTLILPVTLAEPVGAEVIVHCELDAPPAAELIARVDAHTAAAPGRTVTLAVEPEALYFFDPETELALR